MPPGPHGYAAGRWRPPPGSRRNGRHDRAFRWWCRRLHVVGLLFWQLLAVAINNKLLMAGPVQIVAAILNQLASR